MATRKDKNLSFSELRYRMLFKATQAGILILDADSGEIVDVNPFLIKLLGYSKSEFLKKKIWEIGFFGDIARSKAALFKLQNKKYIRYENLPLRTKDGRGIDVEFISNVYRVGNLKVIQCSIRDITDRKKAERAVQARTEDLKAAKARAEQSEKKFKILADFSPDCIKVIDKNRKIVYMNPGGLKEHNFKSLAGAIGWDFIDSIIDEQKEAVKEAFQECITQGKSAIMEVSHKQGTANREWCNFSMAPIKERGRIVAVLAVSRDISELKKRERELIKINEFRKETSRAMLNVLEDLGVARAREGAILMSVGDGLIATDRRGDIMFINKATEKLLGRKKEEITGKVFFKVLLMQDGKGVFIPLEKRPINTALVNGAATSSDQYYYMREDKTKFPVAITVTPIILDGKVIGAINVFRDITKEKAIEKAKNEFLSLASHQLRTPLTGIQWTLERFSKKENFTQEGKKYLDTVFSSVKQLNELVKLLLSVSRIESGGFKTSPELIDLVEFIEKSLGELRPICEKRKIILVFSGHPEKLELKIDKSALSHILGNLAENAVYYTRPGGKAEISLEAKDGRAVLKIKDNGIGIPLKDQPGVFGKFIRASNANTLKPDGTGLGLYIVKEMVKLLNGKTWFESEEGKGTTFYVELPISL